MKNAIDKFRYRNKLKKKEQITIGLTTLGLSLVCVLLLLNPPKVHAYEIMGVDYDRIDWCKLCSSIAPIRFENCDVVHPTFVALVSKIRANKLELSNLKCEETRKQFNILVTNKKKCKFKFKQAFKNLVTAGDSLEFSAENFRDKYLTEGVVDVDGVVKSRKIIGK